MFKKKRSKSGFGPEADQMLDWMNGKPINVDPKQQALLDQQAAEDEARLTPEDREILAKIERDAVFNKKYVLRSEAERDLRHTIRDSKNSLATALIIFVILPLALIAIGYHYQLKDRIRCSDVPKPIMQQMRDSGVNIPLDCQF